MVTIRPKDIFNRAPDRPLTLSWPTARPGIHILETCLLVAAARIVDARKYCEFGTYLGQTTLNLMRNAHPDATITTIDLPAPIEHEGAADQEVSDWHFAAPRMMFEGTEYERRISRLLMDSRTWLYGGPHDVDFVFIDGGHDFPTLDADTLNAFHMLKPGGVIAWHDYGNGDCQRLTEYLDGLEHPCVHVAETMLVFHFDGLQPGSLGDPVQTDGA
jgi:hypothetical protein